MNIMEIKLKWDGGEERGFTRPVDDEEDGRRALEEVREILKRGGFDPDEMIISAKYLQNAVFIPDSE